MKTLNEFGRMQLELKSKAIQFNSIWIQIPLNWTLQLGIMLNNEASVLESFFQIFSMVGKYFSFRKFQFAFWLNKP